MLNKMGKTPKSYVKNLENIESPMYFCFDCDRIIKNMEKDICPFCNGSNISLCKLEIVQENENLDDEVKNRHT